LTFQIQSCKEKRRTASPATGTAGRLFMSDLAVGSMDQSRFQRLLHVSSFKIWKNEKEIERADR
jgi:hypothetical protein